MLMGEASTPQILEWTRVRKLMRGERLVPNDYGSTHRALGSIGAVRVRRSSGRGRAWLWRWGADSPRRQVQCSRTQKFDIALAGLRNLDDLPGDHFVGEVAWA